MTSSNEEVHPSSKLYPRHAVLPNVVEDLLLLDDVTGMRRLRAIQL
jgi:hypothetical protein